ncbi:MAG TPA: hypothetical protein VLT86_16395 [Vicinamibacterales bacterium]|nr:hypothetical protein [Vicinamibacterales bacterium]
MHLDLRYPIGLLLTLYGAILALQGAFVRATVLGLNVNLYWGGVMIVAGVTALYFARRRGTLHTRDESDRKDAPDF